MFGLALRRRAVLNRLSTKTGSAGDSGNAQRPLACGAAFPAAVATRRFASADFSGASSAVNGVLANSGLAWMLPLKWSSRTGPERANRLWEGRAWRRCRYQRTSAGWPRVGSLLGVAGLAAVLAWAQTFQASLRGRVFD